MSRTERYQANVELMEEAGELDGCEEFQLMDEELDGEAVFPVFGAVWRGEMPEFDETGGERALGGLTKETILC